MGRYITKINNTYVEYGDYSWDYVKCNKPKEYYDKQFITVDVEENNKKYTINIPIKELVDIKLVKKLYTWEFNDKKSLSRWLFNYLRKRGEKIECVVSATVGTFYLKYKKPKISGYYLQSAIGDENIILTTKKKIHEIKEYEDFEWLTLRFLQEDFNQIK